MLDSEGCAVMKGGGFAEMFWYSRARRLWAPRVAIVRRDGRAASDGLGGEGGS